MQGRHRERVAQAERDELPGVGSGAGVVDLVDDHQHRLARRRKQVATWASSSVRPVAAVDHEQHHPGVGHGLLGLAGHLGIERVAAGQPAAGVDEREGTTLPLGVDHLAVPGDAGPLLDDGLAPPDDAVEQRRLAHVGATDDGDGRQGGRDDATGIGRRRVGADRRRAVAGGRRAWSGLQGGAERDAVGGHDLDGTGQIGRGEAVEEAAVGQADVGQQVAVAGRLLGEHPAPGPRPPAGR